jgi:succinoglycan biosynthesis transport protein ExoP
MSDSAAHMPLSGAAAQSKAYTSVRNDDQDIDVRNLLLMLWRRKMVVLGCILLGLSLATITMSFMKPRFVARSIILIEVPVNPRLDELQAFRGAFRVDSSFILSEIEIMKSRSLARKVVDRLNLLADPEFNSKFRYSLRKSDTQGEKKLTAAQEQDFKKLSVYGSELENLPPEVVNKEIADVITNFLNNLAVRSVPGSNAIQIEYTSVDPNKAALVANAVVDVYIEQRLEQKFLAAKKVTDWLDERLTTLRAQVQEADKAVVKYKEQHKLTLGSRNSPISSEQLSALNAQLVVAKTRQAEAEAKLKHVQDMAQNPDKIETTAEILNSVLIQSLKHDKATLEGRVFELSGRYGPKHPELVKAKSELNELNQALREEILKSSKTIENEVMFAKASVHALEEGLSEYQGQQFSDNEATIGLDELERQAESTRLIYDTFLKTYKKNDEQEKLQSPEARVISFAIAPRTPAYPNKMLMLSLGGAISLFIGLAIALLIEKLDNTFRSANQIERQTGYPCYALIPAVENMTQNELMNYIISKPSSIVAESVRTLRLVLSLRAPKGGPKPRCITITSSFPNEGKTTLSLWLARLAAKSGEKVIIIDGDLRRPNVHRAMAKSNDASIVDYLTGHKSLEEVIQRDEASGLHMICARSVPNSALDLVGSDKMAKLVASLRQVYDLVIIDSPACLAVSDARVLTRMSDQLVYVVAWDRTPREVVQSGVKQFSDMNYENVSFVLSNVDVKRHVRYGYGDTAYYYGRYKEYYAD